MAEGEPLLLPRLQMGHPQIPAVHKGHQVRIVGAHGGVEPGAHRPRLNLVGKDGGAAAATAAAATVHAVVEGAAGREEDAASIEVDVVAGDAPGAHLLTLPH